MPEELQPAPPQPEREPLPSYSVFNLDAMTDEQILTTGRAFYALMEARYEDRAQVKMTQTMANVLSDDFRTLAARHPNRARGIVDHLIALREGQPHHGAPDDDLSLATYWSLRIAPVDYEFTKSRLLHLGKMRGAFDAVASASSSLEYYVTPEQYADWEEAFDEF